MPLVRRITTDTQGNATEEWADDPSVLTVEQGQALDAEVARLEANRLTIEQKAEQYLADSAAFLALQSPTNAQTLAQVRQNTRAIRGLVRLLRRKFDSAD